MFCTENKFKQINNKIKDGRKTTKEERILYHTYKKKYVSTLYLFKPDQGYPSYLLSKTYHENCIKKAKGNKKYLHNNKKLYNMAINYTDKVLNKKN